MFKGKRLILIVSAVLALGGCSSEGSAPIVNAWNQVASTQKVHRVQPGETIYSIAWRYGVSEQNIASWNHLSPPYALSIGQKLIVHPSAEQAVTPASSMSTIAAPTTFIPDKGAAVMPATATSDVAKQNAVQATVAPAEKSEGSAVAKSQEPADLSGVKSTTATKVVASNGSNWSWPVKGKVVENFDENGSKGLDIAVPAGTPVKAVQDGVVVYSGSNLRGYGQLLIIKQKDDILTAYAHNSRLLFKEGATVKKGQTIAMSGDTEASQAMLHFEVRKAGKPVDPLAYLKQ